MTTEINWRSKRMLTGVERFLADYRIKPSGSPMEEPVMRHGSETSGQQRVGWYRGGGELIIS